MTTVSTPASSTPQPDPPSNPTTAASATFADRHIGPDTDGLRRILELLDQDDLDALEAAAVPATIRDSRELDLPPAASEAQALVELRALAAKNRRMIQMIGLGYHDTITPGVIKRNVLENPAWYTAYTCLLYTSDAADEL